MVALAQVDYLGVPLAFAYNMPFRSVLGFSTTWSSMAGQAISASTQLFTSAIDVRSYACICTKDEAIVVRTPRNPSQTTDLVAGVSKAGDQWGLVYADADTLGDAAVWGNMVGVPSGVPRTVQKQILRQRRRFPSASNDSTIGPARYGWTQGRPLLGVWRCPSLSPPNFILNLSDGSTVAVAANGFSTLDVQAWFDPPCTAVLPYQAGWRMLVEQSSQMRFITFSAANGFAREDVTLAGDPAANTAFQTNSYTKGVITCAGSQGWIVHLPNTPSIFPGQQLRIIYISKVSNTWRDLRLTGLDATASARIAASITESFKLCQSELDGNFYGKADNSGAISDQVLISPSVAERVGAPRNMLPDYHDYDMPYGMEFN